MKDHYRHRFSTIVLISILILQSGCDSQNESENKSDWIWVDIAGTWSATVVGQLADSGMYSAPLVISLHRDGTPYFAPEYAIVELRGSWHWGPQSGTAYGFWNAGGPASDQDAKNSNGRCPEFYTVCTFKVTLTDLGTGLCGHYGDGEVGYPAIHVRGWVEDSETIRAAMVKGEYWFGPRQRPCSGETAVLVDADVELQRSN